jgi:Mak10 subunit, NatC N(alpha)-terminal acetyltransferase
MNGHVEKEDLVERHWRSLESSPQAYQWKDIQDDFAMWSLDLEEGELLSICNFSLYDAMSAIELMDAKMDIGLLLKDRKVRLVWSPLLD